MTKVATIRKRSREEAAMTDMTCTPVSITERLPLVDFDPCSNSRSTVKARWSFSLEKGLDGLKLPWRGSGYRNFPYSFPMPWCVKGQQEMLAGNCTELITLCKLDPSTDWWKVMMWFDRQLSPEHPLAFPPDLWLLNERVQHDEHPDVIEQRRLERVEKALKEGRSTEGITGESTSNFCSVIVHHHGIGQPILELDDIGQLWVRSLR